MRNIEKALVLLQKTRDGDALSPGHLHLVQLACNEQLTTAGEAAFDELYQAVDRGEYSRPWFHGIEHLTRRHTGYVYWRDVEIEHFSFNDSKEEAEAAIQLAERCKLAESRGFPVNGRTTDSFSPFAEAPADTPWVETMMSFYTMFEVDGKAKELILYLPGEHGHAVSMALICGELVVRYAFDEMGGYTLFHALQNEGMTSCSDRMKKYASFVQCMAEANITPEAVSRTLAADVSHLLPVKLVA